MFGLGVGSLIISNEKVNNIIEIVKSVKKFGLLLKSISETFKNEAKNKNKDFCECY